MYSLLDKEDMEMSICQWVTTTIIIIILDEVMAGGKYTRVAQKRMRDLLNEARKQFLKGREEFISSHNKRMLNKRIGYPCMFCESRAMPGLKQCMQCDEWIEAQHRHHQLSKGENDV